MPSCVSFGAFEPRAAAPASSASALVDALLAETPRIEDEPTQHALTERFLRPALPQLEVLFLGLRDEVDAALQPAEPEATDKPYPLGRCLGITIAVQKRLAALDPSQLENQARLGHAALSAFLQAGGVLRRAWGDLRGRYFQNALLAGDLYVDVANDTVVPTKPKVEILPFAKSGFAPIADYRHYAGLAGRYWGQRVLPNHLAPELAPFLPLIQVSANGRVSLGPASRYMLGMTLSQGFAPSREALSAPPLAAHAFRAMVQALAGVGTTLARDPEQGRALALSHCDRAAAGAACVAHQLGAALKSADEANRRLAALRAAAVPAAAAA